MPFRASFCDPFSPQIQEVGRVDPDSIIDRFERIDWVGYLERMKLAPEEDLHFSPSLEIENIETRTGLSISAVGEPGNWEFYIFFKRPRRVRRFFGMIDKIDENFVSEKTGQSWQDAVDCLKALIEGRVDFLEKKIG